jgi:hypothetical protein
MEIVCKCHHYNRNNDAKGFVQTLTLQKKKLNIPHHAQRIIKIVHKIYKMCLLTAKQ